MKLLIGSLALFMVILAFSFPAEHHPLRSVLKVQLNDGHGSGVVIANGLFLTAAHVAGDQRHVRVKDSDGNEANADILWTDPDSDIALGEIGHGLNVEAAELKCGPVAIGEAVNAIGNPLDQEFLTTLGTVAGITRRLDHWPFVQMLDLTVVPGMSGGPVFNTAGQIIGLVVAVQSSQLGMTRFGGMVPSTQICHMLARI